MSGRDWHRPLYFDDDDELPPFKHGEMKRFKKGLADHAKRTGLTEQGKRIWRAGNRISHRPREKK
jgi:hypothetical protein